MESNDQRGKSPVQIRASFLKDIKRIFAARLVDYGYEVPADTSDDRADAERICRAYWNAAFRRIPAALRSVLWSEELKARLPSLNSAVREGLELIERESLEGMDIYKRFSRGLKLLERNDQMLHDWAIYHLHLSDVEESDGFVSRTGQLLFVMARPDALYFLDVRPHGVWADDEFVNIIHRNWPEQISDFKLEGVEGGHLSIQQRKNLRSKNGNAGVLTEDGTFYSPLGGGMVGAGQNLQAIRWTDMTLWVAEFLDAALASDEVQEQILKNLSEAPSELFVSIATIENDHAIVRCSSHTESIVARINFP